MVTGTGTSIPGPGRWTWRSRGCGPGSYSPDWLLERRRRAEAALTSVVATCYLLGVSTRRMEKLVESLGITRPLDAGPYTFAAADALVLKVREGGRVVNVHARAG